MKTDIHASQDAAVADLVRAGQVRIGMFPPHYIKDATTGELKGWGVDLALALAARIGVEARPVEYPGPDKLLEGLNADACDAGFLVNSPVWANAVDYSQPFLQQDFTFLLPPGSSIRSIVDVDRPEVRIAVVRHHASTLELARILRQATMVSDDTLQGAFELLRNGQTNAFASTRPQLLEDSTRLPGSAVLEDRYGVVFSVMGVAKGRSARLAYINEFLRHAKASGLVQRVLDRAGWRGVHVVYP
jgi:polar amino acid transport system substrate-binding protein